MKSAAIALSTCLGAALTGLWSVAASANPERWQINLTPGVTQISHRIYHLHMLGFYLCVVIGIIVFGAMFIAMFRFRKSQGAVAAQWSHSTRLEIMWTIVPVIILVVLAWPATKLLVSMADVEHSNMTVQITGYQWKWRYQILDYFGKPYKVDFISSLDADSNRVRQLGSGLDPASVKDGDYESYLLNVDKPLVLPVGVKIRFLVTAADVIHAWWLPALGWKQDAVPGVINDQWSLIDKPGTYRGQCAELCGRGHGFMPIVVRAVSKADFEQWLAQQEATVEAAEPAAAKPAPAPAATAAPSTKPPATKPPAPPAPSAAAPAQS
ncbi:MAG: cytochrome c oxidase subunit II [Rhodanobacteraceae bacterium]